MARPVCCSVSLSEGGLFGGATARLPSLLGRTRRMLGSSTHAIGAPAPLSSPRGAVHHCQRTPALGISRTLTGRLGSPQLMRIYICRYIATPTYIICAGSAHRSCRCEALSSKTWSCTPRAPPLATRLGGPSRSRPPSRGCRPPSRPMATCAHWFRVERLHLEGGRWRAARRPSQGF